jgi:2-desacetyl-2-hydroxyethyl bacteriochlorophyllide A dehydrogenase
MQSRAILFTGMGSVQLGTIEIPALDPEEVLVQTTFSAISPGTERRCLTGQQAGAPPFPFVPGYALSGRVLRVGAAAPLEPGTRVFCTGTQRLEGAGRLWGGHVAHAIVPFTALRLVPDSVCLEYAALTKLASIAFHGVRLSRPEPHETVLVVGLGPIGSLSARLHARVGCRVIGVDPLTSRRSSLEDIGVQTVESLEHAEAWLPDGADIVVDATGIASVLTRALRLAKTLPWDDHDASGARVLIQGSYAQDIALPYDAVFQREAVIFTPRDAQPRDERAVLEFMARGELKLDDLVGNVFAPEDAEQVYANLGQQAYPTALFRWS